MRTQWNDAKSVHRKNKKKAKKAVEEDIHVYRERIGWCATVIYIHIIIDLQKK